MKATILSQEAVPIGADPSEVHRFTFILDDGQTLPRSRVISLRTARVLVAELTDADAFVKMLREIVRTEPADYDALPGQVFNDGDAAHQTPNRFSREKAGPEGTLPLLEGQPI